MVPPSYPPRLSILPPPPAIIPIYTQYSICIHTSCRFRPCTFTFTLRNRLTACLLRVTKFLPLARSVPYCIPRFRSCLPPPPRETLPPIPSPDPTPPRARARPYPPTPLSPDPTPPPARARLRGYSEPINYGSRTKTSGGGGEAAARRRCVSTGKVLSGTAARGQKRLLEWRTWRRRGMARGWRKRRRWRGRRARRSCMITLGPSS
jgi:hypothetical protein